MSPVVLDAVEQYDQNRKKHRAGNRRTLQAKEAKLERDKNNMTRRENIKIDRTDS